MDSAWKACFAVVVMCLARQFVTFPSPQALEAPPANEGNMKAPSLKMTLDTPSYKAHNAVYHRLQFLIWNAPPRATVFKLNDFIVKETFHLLNDAIVQPQESITVATGVWMPRDASRRKEYSDRVQMIESLLQIRTIPMVVFTDESTYHRLLPSADLASARLVVLSESAIVDMWGTANDAAAAVRENPAWPGKEENIDTSLLHLAAPLLLREASRANPFSSAVVLWVDVLNDCFRKHIPTKAPTAHPLSPRGAFLVGFSSAPVDTLSADDHVMGFRQPSFNFYADAKSGKDIRLVSSSIFGGSPLHNELVAYLYESNVRSAVNAGLLASRDAFLSAVSNRFPEVFEWQEIDSEHRECAVASAVFSS